MALVVPDAGETALLDKMLKTALSVDENYTLKLYKNDFTPISTTVAGDMTVADFTGYGNKTLSRAGWGASTTVSGSASATYGAQQSWTASSTQTIYGYYIVGATSGTCLWAERFSTSRTLASNDILNLTPVFTLTSAN